MGRGQSGSTTFKKSTNKRKIYKYDEEGIDDLEFTRDYGASQSREVIVLVDVKKLDDNWKREKSFYIDSNGNGEIKGRREEFRRFLKKKEPIEVSRIYISKDGQVSFRNGRHRFSILRDDRKAKKVPVAIERSQLKRFKKYLGD